MKQDYKVIEKLIEQFFEGQTSNEEERELYNFFSSGNVPEHLLPYRQVFAYFETGIKEEPNYQKTEPKPNQFLRNKNIKTWASIAASLLILISLGIYHFTQKKEFNPYEGSYIVRNGIKITDPKIVNPEIEKTLLLAQQQEKEFELLVKNLHELSMKDPFEQAEKEIKKQQSEWVEQVEDEIIRNELLEIFNLKL